VVLALAVAPSWAAPPPGLRVNGRMVERLKPDLMIVRGQVMWDVYALMHEIGGTARVEGDHVRVYRGARYVEMTVTRRQFTVDGEAQLFTVAPFAQGGTIYVPVGEIVCLFDGHVAWDPATRVVSVDIPGGDVYGGPDPLRLNQPVDGAVVRDTLIIEGYTRPDREVQVDVWRRQEAGLFSWQGQAIYHKVLYSDGEGWFRGQVTLTAEGLHKVEAELLNCTGGTNARVARLIEGLVSGAPPPLPGPPDCSQTSCLLQITSPLHGANLQTGVLEAVGWATVGSTIEVEMRQDIRRLALTRVRPDHNGRWLARVALTHPGLPHTGLYTIRARLFDRTGRPQIEQLVSVQLSLPGPPTR
jgi:hypothetical protein